jgi:hypothetical protein
MKYWSECATKERTSQLIDVRGVVVKVSKYGCEGKTWAIEKLVSFDLINP